MALALALVAVGIRGLTQPSPIDGGEVPDRPSSVPPKESAAERIETPFFLTLSAPASEVILEAGDETLRLTSTDQQLSGSLALKEGHPTIFLTVRWRESTPQPRFAKLRLEPIGLPTQEKIFDGMGELSDVWEPHLH